MSASTRKDYVSRLYCTKIVKLGKSVSDTLDSPPTGSVSVWVPLEQSRTA